MAGRFNHTTNYLFDLESKGATVIQMSWFVC